MSPVTHFLIGWVTSNCGQSSIRERVAITLAGIAPDIDGLGVVVDFLAHDEKLTLWSKYHHVLAHNLAFACLFAGVCFLLAKQRLKTALLALLSFHLHLFCDLAGSRGPDGYQWPVPYFFPFSKTWEITWQGQWQLNAWPNFLITFSALALTFYLAWKRGFSPLEMVSARANEELIKNLRRRFSNPCG